MAGAALAAACSASRAHAERFDRPACAEGFLANLVPIGQEVPAVVPDVPQQSSSSQLLCAAGGGLLSGFPSHPHNKLRP